MNLVKLWQTTRDRAQPRRGLLLFVLTVVMLAGPLNGATADPAAPTAEAVTTEAEGTTGDDIITMAAHNAKADRIEDFGLRVESSFYSKPTTSTVGFFFTAKFAPIITAIVPNTAAAKAGLRPGERILKSEGQSTVGGAFSTGKLGKWYKIQTKKWAEVAAGKTNVTWTLEIETPATKAVRTVKLVVPTSPPHWGSSTWRMPEGRIPSAVAESGPLAERSRAVLDNGIWTLLKERYARLLGLDFKAEPGPDTGYPTGLEPTGYEWHVGNRVANSPEGVHRIFVTQFRGRTDIFFETDSPSTRGLYLTSPSGALEKASQWGRGGEASPEEARAGFEHELDFWTTKIEKGTGRWPFAVKAGYDANTFYGVVPAKGRAPGVVVVRPLAEEFLKLPPATEAQRAMLADAFGKLGADSDQWAYTETSRGLEDKRVFVTRVDPSKPEAGRSVLLSIDGKAPKPADVQSWRDDGGDTPKPLGEIPPLAGLVDLKELRVFKDEIASVVFEAPLQNGSAEFPREKFQALFRVNKTQRAFEDVTVKQRDSFRVAGVVKVVDTGLEMRFQTLDPALAPQPVFLKMGGGVRVLLVKFSRSFEATRTDFKRVVPFDEAAAPAK